MKSAVAPVATAVVGAAAGVIGGVVLGRARHPRKRTADGMANLAKNVNEAGKQFGKLAGEVRTARQKAESIAKALS